MSFDKYKKNEGEVGRLVASFFRGDFKPFLDAFAPIDGAIYQNDILTALIEIKTTLKPFSGIMSEGVLIDMGKIITGRRESFNKSVPFYIVYYSTTSHVLFCWEITDNWGLDKNPLRIINRELNKKTARSRTDKKIKTVAILDPKNAIIKSCK